MSFRGKEFYNLFVRNLTIAVLVRQKLNGKKILKIMFHSIISRVIYTTNKSGAFIRNFISREFTVYQSPFSIKIHLSWLRKDQFSDSNLQILFTFLDG